MSPRRVVLKVTFKPIFHCNAKLLSLEASRLFTPPTRQFHVTYTNMLVSKNRYLPNVTPYLANATPYLPNASRWNMGRVGSPHFGAHVGHVDFMLFMSISFAFGSQRKCFLVEYGPSPFLVPSGLQEMT